MGMDRSRVHGNRNLFLIFKSDELIISKNKNPMITIHEIRSCCFISENLVEVEFEISFFNFEQ